MIKFFQRLKCLAVHRYWFVPVESARYEFPSLPAHCIKTIIILSFFMTESFKRSNQNTYMVALNVAAGLCLPRPVVNLRWEWRLSLKFACHFIFWCYTPNFKDLALVGKDKWMNFRLAFTIYTSNLPRFRDADSYPACIASYVIIHFTDIITLRRKRNELFLLHELVFVPFLGVLQLKHCLCNGRKYSTKFRYTLCSFALIYLAQDLASAYPCVPSLISSSGFCFCFGLCFGAWLLIHRGDRLSCAYSLVLFRSSNPITYLCWNLAGLMSNSLYALYGFAQVEVSFNLSLN